MEFPNYEINYYAFNPAEDFSSIYGGLPRENVLALAWMRNLYQTTHQIGLSLLILSDGRHRTGKSLFWSFIGCVLDKTFYEEMPRRVVSSAEELYDLIEELDKR
jgi:hypothetical protein